MNTGIKPIRYNVLIDVDEVTEKDGTIWKPEQLREREQYGHDIGTLIDCGPLAFSKFGDSRIPQIGDKILFDKYKGKTFRIPKENDERGFDNFRVILDEEVIAILEEGRWMAANK